MAADIDAGAGIATAVGAWMELYDTALELNRVIGVDGTPVLKAANPI